MVLGSAEIISPSQFTISKSIHLTKCPWIENEVKWGEVVQPCPQPWVPQPLSGYVRLDHHLLLETLSPRMDPSENLSPRRMMTVYSLL